MAGSTPGEIAGEAPHGIVGAFARLGGASMISMALQLVRGKVTALFLGTSGVGVFNQLSLLWNVVTIIGSLGLQNGIIHHAAQHLRDGERAALEKLVSTSFCAMVALALILAGCGTLWSGRLSDLLFYDGGAHAGFVALVMLCGPISVLTVLYRSLLSAARAVPALVRAQVGSDVIGGVVFAVLAWLIGLTGAVLGFLATNALFMVFMLAGVRKILGGDLALPRLRLSGTVLRQNVGFGVSGLVLIAASNLAALAVSSLVIARLGVGANGIYSSAYRLSGVYLAAVTATAISYFLPTLSESRNSAQLSAQVNRVLQFYLLVLPPLMAVIIAAGQQIVWLILSSEFAPAATLLILLVPAELARTIAETVGLSLLARRRIVPYTLTYFVFVMIFVGGSIETIDRFGLAGIAASYLTAQITTCIVVLGFAARMLQLRLDQATVRGCVAGVALLTAVGVASWSAPPVATRAAVLLFALAAWAISRWLDPHAGDMTFLRSWVKGRRPSAP